MVVHVAVGAGQVVDAAALEVELPALLEVRLGLAVHLDLHRHVAGLHAHQRRHTQHLVAFPLPGLCLHVFFAADADLVFDGDQLLGPLVHQGIVAGLALHGLLDIAMAGRAGLAGLALDLLPFLLGLFDPQEGRVLEVVVLDVAGLGLVDHVAGVLLTHDVVLEPRILAIGFNRECTSGHEGGSDEPSQSDGDVPCQHDSLPFSRFLS